MTQKRRSTHKGSKPRGGGRRPDHYSQKAQDEGLAARSVYKLQELDQRWGLFKTGMRVLDLGCSPGSWMQYAARRVGPSGFVQGYDLKPVNAQFPPHARADIGDVYALLETGLDEAFDVVLSDMAPSTMGHHGTDALRSEALVEAALGIAEKTLRPGGHVVVKLLEGKGAMTIFDSVKHVYTKAYRIRPKATRTRSTEIFLVGLGKC